MSSVALYRKYRSADLNDIVGQTHITQTLEQSLKNNQLSHAYLLTGPRGTGKTSVARILARRINKLSSETDISQYLDIIEIDAASNRGIDEIRSLREKIQSAPTSLEYKVYIIDEAHMLTREAFNALLKTLEEPPSHVVFILATTEAHKLPDTIISRTQRYDFRPFSVEVITDHLSSIVKQEKMNVAPEAILAIAELSQGGMRDAISMLDQLAASGQPVTAALVQSHMGLSSQQQLTSLIQALQDGDQNAVMQQLTTLFASGIEPQALTVQLQFFVRSLLFDMSQASKQDQSSLLTILSALQEAQRNFRYSPHPSLPLELALMKAMRSKTSVETNNVATTHKQHVESTSQPTESTENNKERVSSPMSSEQADVFCAKGLSIIKEHNNSLYALLRSGGAHLKDNKMVVECRFDFHKQRIEEHRNREIIEKVMSRVCKQPIELACTLQKQAPKAEKQTNQDEELMASAMAILGGEVVDG